MPIRIGPDGSPGLVAGVFFFTGEIQSITWRLKKISYPQKKSEYFSQPPVAVDFIVQPMDCIKQSVSNCATNPHLRKIVKCKHFCPFHAPLTR